MESQRAKNLFSLVDHAELFDGNGRAIGNPRGQAGGGRLVPCGKSMVFRQLPDFFLSQSGFDEGAADFQFRASLPARTVIAGIVQVVAVNYVAKSTLHSHPLEQGVQLVFTEVATI